MTNGRSFHLQRVREFQHAIGHETPEKPKVPDRETGLKVLKMLIEEVSELADVMGYNVRADIADRFYYIEDLEVDADGYLSDEDSTYKIQNVARECADVSATIMGILAVYGIKDIALFHEVDSANLRKCEPEAVFDTDGKLTKPDGWKRPNIKKVLAKQL